MGDDRRARLQALAARAGRQREVVEVVEAAETGEDGANDDEPPPSTSHQEEEGESSTKRTISFRNYAPQDKSLEQQSGTSPGQQEEGENDFDATELSSRTSTKRQRVDEENTTTRTASSLTEETPTTSSGALQLALAKARNEMKSTGIDGRTTTATATISTTVTAMAPKKVNWDLKRDIADKLAKLERRTQKAIVEMLKERLEVQATEAANEDDDDDDDDDNLD
jgi:coiled-coil domain-containing protein 12